MAFRHSCCFWNWKIFLRNGKNNQAKEKPFLQSLKWFDGFFFYIYINLMGWKWRPFVIKYVTIFRWIWYFTPSINVGDVVQEIRRSFTPKFFISRLEKSAIKSLYQCLHKFVLRFTWGEAELFEDSVFVSEDYKLGKGWKVTFIDCKKVESFTLNLNFRKIVSMIKV